MAPAPSQRLYEMGRKLRESEEQPITALPEHLHQPPNPSRPLKREITIEEVFDLYSQVQRANASWMLDSENNKVKVCTLFTDPNDPRISHRLDLKDMVAAATILSPYLDRVPKPEPPRFPDDDLTQPLSDGTLPLPLDAPAFVQRKSSLLQMKNLIDRLKKFEVWQREEQEQEPQ